jgi:hypothetical protein
MDTLIYLGSLKESGGGPTLESYCKNGHINTMVKTGIEVLCRLSKEGEMFSPFFMENGFKLYN